MGTLCASPTPKAVRQVLADLLGRDVQLQAESHHVVREDEVAAVAVYVSETGSLAALCACDVALGASLGCSLALLPPGRVNDSVRYMSIDTDVSENLYEVFNVMSTLFNAEGRPHIILDGMIIPPDKLPSAVARMLGSPVGHLPVTIGVQGYGEGAMTVVVR
jgi:hypothetical protein